MPQALREKKEDEKRIDIAMEKTWEHIVEQLKAKGLLAGAGVNVKNLDWSILDKTGRKSYTLDEIRNVFQGWAMARVDLFDKQGAGDRLKKKNEELGNAFLTVIIASEPVRKKLLTRHAVEDKKYDAGTEVPTHGKPTFSIGATRGRQTDFGDSVYSGGIYYKTGEEKGLMAGASLGGGYARAGQKDAKVGVNQSATEAYVEQRSKKGFDAVVGLVAGPFTYGYNFAKKTFAGGFEPAMAIFDLIMTTITGASWRSKEKGTGLGSELLEGLKPINLVKTLYEVLAVKPALKLKDLWDWVFNKPGTQAKSITISEYFDAMDAVRKDESYDNLHSARKKLEGLLLRELDPVSKAEVKNELEKIEFRIASKGLPLSLNIFKPSTLFKSKRKVAEDRIREDIEKAMARLDELSRKREMSDGEKAEFIYNYSYLNMKLITADQPSVEGYKMPVYPVPYTSTNPIKEVLERNGKTYASLLAEKSKSLSAEVEAARKTGAGFAAIVENRVADIRILAQEEDYGYDKYIGAEGKRNLLDFLYVAEPLIYDRSFGEMHLDTYRLFKDDGRDEKIGAFFEQQLVERIRKYSQKAAGLATGYARSIAGNEKQIATLEKELREMEGKEGDAVEKDKKAIREEKDKLDQENKKTKVMLIPLVELIGRAGMEASYPQGILEEIRRITGTK